MKVKLFTHTDLDGVGSAIVGKVVFPNIDVEYCNYDDVNGKVKEFINGKKYEDYDQVYITDISVDKEVAELIENTQPNTFKDGFHLNEMFQLLDHHPTALWLNEYFWAKVAIEENGEKTSGTRLFYDYLMQEGYLQQSYAWKYDRCRNLFDFVEIVRKYDTWLWKEKYNDEEPKMWNDLFHIMGIEEFINSILYRMINYSCFDFCDFDIKLLEYKQKEIDNYIESKIKKIIVSTIQGYAVGIVFAEQYISELGNKISEKYQGLDFIAIINMNNNSISYRTTKDYVDLGKIATIYGGGGHAKSAGSPIDEKIKEALINTLFKGGL